MIQLLMVGAVGGVAINKQLQVLTLQLPKLEARGSSN